MTDIDFFVGDRIPDDADIPRPVVTVDGEVVGEDVAFDHHRTGEGVNLDSLPTERIEIGTIATSMIDTDSVVSAAVLLARQRGQVPSDALWAALRAACYYCDHLVAPPGCDEQASRQGLGLHCWVKQMGLAWTEMDAWASGSVTVKDGWSRARPVRSHRSELYRRLARAVDCAINIGVLPQDTAYLARLDAMRENGRRQVVDDDGRICMVSGDEYVDPLAMYAVTRAPVLVRRVVDDQTTPGHWTMRYTIGVSPHTTEDLDATVLARELARIEPAPRDPSWGGRGNVIGSPRVGGTRLQPSQIWSAVDQWLTPHGPPRPVPREVSWLDAYDDGPSGDLIREPGAGSRVATG